MLNIFLEAYEGSKCFLNGKQISVKKGNIEKGDTVMFVNHKSTRSNCDYSKLISHFIQNDVFVMADVCNTFVAAMIIMGKVKCGFITPAHVWDRAAVSIILRSAGGSMLSDQSPITNVFDQPYKHIILTNRDTDKYCLELVNKF
ncbi:MAG: inositol monophosphatase family protein [Patescibacteria group bacterium]